MRFEKPNMYVLFYRAREHIKKIAYFNGYDEKLVDRSKNNPTVECDNIVRTNEK